VLYEMLTGAPPYQAADPFTVALMHVTQPIPKLPADFAWLQPLIDRTMNKQPAERVQTGTQLAEEVHQLLAKAPEGANTLSKTAAKSSNRISTGATVQQRTRMVHRDAAFPRWLWPTVAVVVIGIGVGLYFLLRTPAQLPPAQVLTQAQAQPTTTAGATDPAASGTNTTAPGVVQPKTIEEQYGGDVQTMLDQADAYVKHGTTSAEDIGRNLVGPEGSNATELYRKVLAIQADNQQAKKGLQQIVAYYVNHAKFACSKQLFGACKIVAEDGLKADPDNAELKQLDQQADDASRGITPSGN
jgi:hypothetical protein